ncbi:DNA cytosine methyltransferase, partial [Gammaproteobacteria bacterium]|nr:DNA cytosine methyltransferase [Gammaproteobacteria bacterium]
MNHIELFAGCGGLSLGLETAGFELLIANELSPMAAETFAYNHLNANLEKKKNLDKVYWISSGYPRDEFTARLRENPNNASGLKKNHYSDLLDLNHTDKQLKRSLFVGSIVDLNKILEKRNNGLSKQLRTALGKGEVDLVSGGPPCQSFSLAGLRQHSNDRNQLPWEFVKFVEKVKPKIAMLENVSGILRAFKIEDKKFYAWFEVSKAFAKVGYIPLCLHINAKYVGTAQNRPRFILLALRKDIFKRFKSNCKDATLLEAFKASEKLYTNISKRNDPEYGSLPYFDITKDSELFSGEVLSQLKTHSSDDFVSVKDALDDLRPSVRKVSAYVKRINNVYAKHHKHEEEKTLNHDPRRNNNRVRARFRVYQIMCKLPKATAKEISSFIKSEGATEVSESTLRAFEGYWLLDISGNKIDSPSKKKVLILLNQIYTKKQTQKALIADAPAPAALSIPDDACHYHESVEEQRTLTVREMARIQSFPDWFEIKSKVTTGGQMRRFEVPQYTQIGNAVPPLLGIALGN